MVSELQAAVIPNTIPQRTTVVAAGITPGPGAACVPGGPTQPAIAMIRDPYPHTAPPPSPVGYSVFTEDITFLVYSDETGSVGRTRTHYAVVDRRNTQYSALMVKPVVGSFQNIGSTMQIAVQVEDPNNGCNDVANLNGVLALSVTDLNKKQLITDSEGVTNNPLTSGLSFVSTANQYRSNVTVASPTFTAGNTVRVCVNAKADLNNPTAPRAIGEICQDVLIKGNAKK